MEVSKAARALSPLITAKGADEPEETARVLMMFRITRPRESHARSQRQRKKPMLSC